MKEFCSTVCTFAFIGALPCLFWFYFIGDAEKFIYSLTLLAISSFGLSILDT